MKSKNIGPYTVSELSVDQGLDLIALANKGEPEEFQKAILLRCVKKNGESVDGQSFKEMMPHLKNLIDAAFELNGFQTGDEK